MNTTEFSSDSNVSIHQSHYIFIDGSVFSLAYSLGLIWGQLKSQVNIKYLFNQVVLML